MPRPLSCSPETTIPQIFAVMRQWIPSIQHNMSSLTREVLRRGAHIDDRDGLSDLTLLHYAVKSGAGEGTPGSWTAVKPVQTSHPAALYAQLSC